jgi:peptidoglycan/xylan/chitin deacetylase (PgdA/CDA1 family)
LTRGLTVFIFHEITDSPSAFHREFRLSATPELFRRQLDWITTRFTVIEPPRLRRLGGLGDLPPGAAMITFDDAWEGVFKVGVPILREHGVSALCFLNMATVDGDPDLGAVRAYERRIEPSSERLLTSQLGSMTGPQALEQIRQRYLVHDEFRRYQGSTVSRDDLGRAAESGQVWFGSHLFHHWDIRSIDADLYEATLAQNAEALSVYPNSLPAFSTTHGYAGDQSNYNLFSLAVRHGVQVVFTGMGGQNSDPDSAILDRVTFPMSSRSDEWWFATHRQRVLSPRR